MTTQRVHRSNKLPAKESVIYVTKTVEGYLEWICNSADDTVPAAGDKSKSGDVGFNIKDMLNKAVAMFMLRAVSRSEQFKNFVELAQEKGESVQKLLKKLLVKRSDSEYLLRLFIRKPRHRKQLFNLVNGYPNPLYPEHAMVALNRSLLKEEKVAMRKEMKGLLDADDNISPEVISSWILPVIQNALLDMDGAEVDGYLLETHPVKGQDSYSSLLHFVNVDNTDEAHSVSMDIKIALEMDTLPAKHQLQHPFPHTPAYERKGRELLKQLNSSFQDANESLVLCSELYPSAAKLEKPKKKRKEATEASLTRGQVRLLERSKTAIFGKKRIDSKRVWLMDFSKLEKVVKQRLSKSEKGFRKIDMALKLYNAMANVPSKLVPPLNNATQVALSLWLFKNSSGESTGGQLLTHFTALLHLVQGCLKGNFCPSFFMPSYNTMATKVTPSNPLGIVPDDLFSDLSDSDDTDEEEPEEGIPSDRLETPLQPRPITATENLGERRKKTKERWSLVREAMANKKTGGDDTNRSKQSAADVTNKSQQIQHDDAATNKEQSTGVSVNDDDDGANKQTKNGENRKRKRKERENKKPEVSAEEKIEHLLKLLDSDDLKDVVDYVGIH